MSDKSLIEWTDATWNPVTGCAIVSPGCANCYAMKLAGTRLQHHPSRTGLTTGSKAGPVWTGEVRLNEQWLDQPLRWKRARRIFVCAHGDLFAENVPDDWIDMVFAVMAEAWWHTFQVLTKRSARARAYLSAPDLVDRIGVIQERAHGDNCAYTNVGLDAPWPLANLWLGVSAEDQKRADARIPDLMQTPAAIRFVSAEPLIGPIDFRRIVIDWIIVGGESGQGARPMHPDWARSIREQCAAAGVPFFFKQWGGWALEEGAFGSREQFALANDGTLYRAADLAYPGGERRGEALRAGHDQAGLTAVYQVGKSAAGRLLDGVEHNGMPGKWEMPL